ncbi:hypothetical protein K461DRAFT_286068 [Myriangium duriaei CBS 260.36]|uniref:ER membrane protein complex subunit 4 n=1 Tax=Myriangium duriaei CBS 260.36 TaxID=1168546 RepID=A0A9P4J6J9_9PEZI|nr:hypothetical protein K461DRAFT_286068 [Myriangium duriaei CBS 260.36]
MSRALPPQPPQWVLDLNGTPPKAKNASLPDPPGYSGPTASKGGSKAKNQAVAKERKAPSTDEMDTLKMKKAWEVAIAPAKALPMSAIGMYMTGNSLQIFSIMMVFMLFKTPVTAIMGIQSQFAKFESEANNTKLLGAKLVFIATNLLSLALGIWKVNGMGLLPTTTSDWLAWETAREPLYRARLLQSIP